MLEVTDEGQQVAEQLWYAKRVKDDHEMAFLAAVDILNEFPVQDALDLANRLPFVRDHDRKLQIVNKWIEEGLIER